MLIFDLNTIGNKLLAIRKRAGLTQAEVAEAAGLSDRTYRFCHLIHPCDVHPFQAPTLK